MIPKTYNFKDHYKGDTFNGIQITMLTGDGITPVNLTGVDISVDFRKESKIGELLKNITVGNGITVTTPSTGIFVIEPFIIDWDPLKYYYDIEYTFSNNSVKTYVKGYIKVKQDVTTV